MIPKGDWRCPKCIDIKCEKPRMRMKYGFADSPTEYTIDSFARMANEFKRKYFDGRKPTLSELEKEFWRLVTRPEDEEIDFKVIMCNHCLI